MSSRHVLLMCTALVLSGFWLKALPMPLLWISATWACAFLLGVFCLRRPWSRPIFFLLFNASVLTASLAATEGYFLLHEMEGTVTGDFERFRVRDDVLGVVPAKSQQVHATASKRGHMIFDVTYSIDPNGLRVAPPADEDKTGGCILFFGCSFTFGLGLQDDETLPYQVGIQSKGQYRTFNFGFNGYGPHHMLAAIEQGIVGRDVDCRPDYAVYQAIPNHVARVAGKVSFAKHAPRYELSSDGALRLTGHFDDEKPSWLGDELRWQMSKSAIYRSLGNLEPRVSEDDVRLLLAIVGKSRDLLEAEFHGIKFHIILWQVWPTEESVYRQLSEGFSRMNIPTHRVEDILPHYEMGSPMYVLGGEDRHPNALSDKILADYVLRKIVSTPSDTDGVR